MRARLAAPFAAAALAIAFAAPASAASFDCATTCKPDQRFNTRCRGTCHREVVRNCFDWFAFGCDALQVLPAQSWLETDSEQAARERFLRSLREEAAEPAPAE